MAEVAQPASGSRSLVTWVVIAGAIVFGFSLVALLELRAVFPSFSANGWAVIPLAIVLAALLGLTAARLTLGIGRLAAFPTNDGSSYVVGFWKRPWVPWALIAFALIMFVVVAFGLLGVVQAEKVPNELSLPVLAIAGVVALLGSLAMVAVSFSLVNMADKTQPLGLPQGSVRAVIALSLVVLFAILTVYLFSSLNGPAQVAVVATCLEDAPSAQIVRERPVGELLLRRPATDCPATTSAGNANTTTPNTGNPNTGNPNTGNPNTGNPNTGKYDVVVERPPTQAGIDFAKQLLVLIGTLVTSVASFYFGSQAVAQAHDAVAGTGGPPLANGVEPPTLEPGGGEQGLDVLGTGLNGVRQVQLTRGGDQISAISVTSNDNRVHALFRVPAATVPDDDPRTGGGWDVTVSDTLGRSFRMPAVVRIIKSAAPTPRKDPNADNQKPVRDATSGKDANTTQPAAGTTSPATDTSATDTSTTPATAKLRDLLIKLGAQKADIQALQAVSGGPAIPAIPEAILAELNKWLTTAQGLAKGQTDPATIATALQSGDALLGTVQNAGLPGALADVLALLRLAGSVAVPAIAGIPAGPIGIVFGVLSGLSSLAADQKKLDAAKAALLNAPFDPGTPPPMPTRDIVGTLVEGTPFATATDDQALTIIQAALEQHDGQPGPADEVATKLLANPLVASLMQQFATPALRAAAIEALRGQVLFKQARELLGDTLEIDVPAIADAPAGKINFPTLLDWLQKQRSDPRMAAAIEKLVGIAETLAKVPSGQQAPIELLRESLNTAVDLAQTVRQK